MSWLGGWLGGAREVRALRREVRALREQVESLRAQNERMRAGMRRCLTCDYRLEVVGRR